MSGDLGQPIPILLPQAGNSMEEGTILSWRVKEGDRVQAGDILFELETDKATMEVEAEVAGRISRIVVKEGETAAVKSPVAYFAEDDAAVAALTLPEAAAPPSPAAAPSQAAPAPAPGPARDADPLAPSRPRVSPVARRAAEELGVALEGLAGSGPSGRVLLKDVQGAASAAPAPVQTRQEEAPRLQPARPTGPGARTPMSKMRRAIAKGLTQSKQTIPHWYCKLTIVADPLLALYRQEKALYPCTLNDLLILAVSRTLQEFPIFLGQVDGDEIVQKPDLNIGLAVGLDEGLVVPVLKQADTRSLKGIAQESRRLIEAAKQGKVEGMGEGVFTISNLGMFGVEEFIAIVNPPESAILSVGAAREEVIVKDGAFRVGHKMTLVLSADHRTIDGAVGAKFMGRLKAILESPEALTGRQGG